MNIRLKTINENNWRECVSLKVMDDQEKFVATNENSLALAYAHKEMEPRGIYDDDIMVGFLMFAKDPDDGLYYINRFMIDKRYQGKGFGRKALKILIEELKVRGADTIDVIHKPDNANAIRLYRDLGFKPTDDKLDDNEISRVNLI